uniref:SHSP domain-containing protein n=1 Tax=Rhizophora mucronata TaxID=61149 RepID=A0A2P2QM96_RHIMU
MNPQYPQLKPSVIVTGTAKQGSAGPPIGLVDIGVSKDAYLFRVSLPGIRQNECKLSCEIKLDGSVNIKGEVIYGGAILKNSSGVFEMKVQQLCPPGPFTLSFKLPGPADPRLVSTHFRADGILEVVAYKPKMTSAPVDGRFHA